MARFIQYDRYQHYILPPSVDEWLPEDHLARYIIEVIDQLDLSKLTNRCQSTLKSIHLTAQNNVQQASKVIPFLAPFYAA